MSRATKHRYVYFSETLDDELPSDEKIVKMDEEIRRLQTYVTYQKMMVNLKDDGTTKRGRQIYNMSNNRALMSSIRDVMSETVFPYCKFIGKLDLQTISNNSIAKVMMDKLKVGEQLAIEGEKMDFRLKWWGRNCELVERCLVDHKTKSTQNLKKRYMMELYRRRHDDTSGEKRGTEEFNGIVSLMKTSENFQGSIFQQLKNEDLYASFVGMCAGCIVGYHRYKTSLRKHLSHDPEGLCHKWLTPDDEAMCWLMIENGVDKWNAEFTIRWNQVMRTDAAQGPNYGGFQSTKLTKQDRDSLPMLKYTEKLTENGRKKLCGWDHNGVARFKVLKREIEQFRYDHATVRIGSKEVLKPKVQNVNGKNVFVLRDEYKDYSEHATGVMADLLEIESPDVKGKKRVGQELSTHEQKRKREIDEIFNDGSLSAFSNIACTLPYMEV